MASRAQREVLGTTELLENILLHLDIKTLLLSSQLVEQRWRNLIRHSVVLQQAPTRCFEEKFALFFHDGRRDRATTDVHGPRRTVYIQHRRGSQACDLQFKHFPALPLAAGEAARAAFMRPEASWRRMLVTQPPTQRVGFSEETSHMSGMMHRFSALRMDADADEDGGGGLRMGALYDAAASWVLAADHPSFGIMWNPAGFQFPIRLSHYTERTRQIDIDEKEALAGRVDVLLTLAMGPTQAEREEMGRERDAFREKFVHPGARGKPSIQATKTLWWKKHCLDGTAVEERFGWVEY
ncbi:hypothetical protein PG994_013641 [Apiospora phragmitis]|uniref:F-box domain-containing protein n=1 Tax=Apiospora phragmitis TaxID=2905665 RepID=A0ABR1TBT8_9PEZI